MHIFLLIQIQNIEFDDSLDESDFGAGVID